VTCGVQRATRHACCATGAPATATACIKALQRRGGTCALLRRSSKNTLPAAVLPFSGLLPSAKQTAAQSDGERHWLCAALLSSNANGRWNVAIRCAGWLLALSSAYISITCSIKEELWRCGGGGNIIYWRIGAYRHERRHISDVCGRAAMVTGQRRRYTITWRNALAILPYAGGFQPALYLCLLHISYAAAFSCCLCCGTAAATCAAAVPPRVKATSVVRWRGCRALFGAT